MELTRTESSVRPREPRTKRHGTCNNFKSRRQSLRGATVRELEISNSMETEHVRTPVSRETSNSMELCAPIQCGGWGRLYRGIGV